MYRGSSWQMLFKIGVLKNFAIDLESLFHKDVGLKALKRDFLKNLLKNRRRCFPVNTAKFLRRAFFIEHLYWQLLSFLLNPFQANDPFLYQLETSEKHSLKKKKGNI